MVGEACIHFQQPNDLGPPRIELGGVNECDTPGMSLNFNKALVQVGSIQDWHCDGCDRVKDPKGCNCQRIEHHCSNTKMYMQFIYLRLWIAYTSFSGLLRIGMTPIIFARRIALPILLWLFEVRPVMFRL
jgi:hypothetical protein